MKQIKIPAVFMRGGTSKAMMLHDRDLPRDHALWDEIFLAMLGSPDSYGRQLDGMGGGLQSLSKVCVIGAPTRADADVDYTFAQVEIKEARVDHTKNSGNMVSAVGPFAVDEGLVQVSGNEAIVRIHITNTHKLLHARFALDEGKAAVDGDLATPGVTGTGAPVALEFIEPGGAVTGKLLPTGNTSDVLDVPGVGSIRASLVDAATAACFVNAADVGLSGSETPEEIEASADVLPRLAKIRLAACVAMGLAKDRSDAERKGLPVIGLVSGPLDSKSLSGEAISSSGVDLTARMITGGRPHRALPVTSSLCMAVAARIEGSVVNRAARPGADPASPTRIAMPSGVMVVGASVTHRSGGWHVEKCAVYRTQRRLFEGYVLVSASRVPKLIASLGKSAA